MSVRRKILLIFGAAFLGTGFLLYFVGRGVLLEGYSRIEHDLVRDGVARATSALQDGLGPLSSTCADWAGWNDTRDFVLGTNTSFIQDNLGAPSSLSTIHVNFIAIYNAANELKHLACADLDGEAFQEPPAGLVEALASATALFQHAAPDDDKTGLLNLPNAPALVAASPITNNERGLPQHGTLIIGRYLDAAMTAQLAERIRQDLSILRVETAEAGALMETLRPLGIEDGAVAVFERDENTISGYVTLRDLTGAPLILVCVDFPRTVLKQGIVTTNVFGAVLTIVAAIALLIVVLFLEFVVLQPLNALADHVRRIHDLKDLSLYLKPRARDEVGALTEGINGMVEKLRTAQFELENVQRKLVETARIAGMSEVASGVLHNVGNVMNSVNVTAATLRSHLEGSKVPNLTKATEMLAAHEADLATFLTSDEKGVKLPGYLESLSRHLNGEHETSLDTCEQLMNHIRHTIEIITLQQSYARNVRVIELVAIDGVIEDAIAMNAGGLDRHGVHLARDFQPLPPLPCDRHRLLQILVNLLSNAKYAVSASSNPDKTITISLRRTGTGTIQIDVADTGIGIDPDNLAGVFAYGFTTREGGHGIGLHSCALAAQEVGGTLTARSDGLGKGALFRLEIPCEHKDHAK